MPLWEAALLRFGALVLRPPRLRIMTVASLATISAASAAPARTRYPHKSDASHRRVGQWLACDLIGSGAGDSASFSDSARYECDGPPM